MNTANTGDRLFRTAAAGRAGEEDEARAAVVSEDGAEMTPAEGEATAGAPAAAELDTRACTPASTAGSSPTVVEYASSSDVPIEVDAATFEASVALLGASLSGED